MSMNTGLIRRTLNNLMNYTRDNIDNMTARQFLRLSGAINGLETIVEHIGDYSTNDEKTTERNNDVQKPVFPEEVETQESEEEEIPEGEIITMWTAEDLA